MKKLLALALAVSLCLFSACSTSEATIEENPKLADLNYFCQTLEKKHKNLYAKISKEDFAAEKDRIAALTPTMTDDEYYFSLKHLLSLVGDSHTNMAYNDSPYKHMDALGFAVMRFDDGWYLAMLEKQNEQHLGSRLLSINNVDIEEVYTRSRGIMSSDNDAWAQKQFSNTINFREPLEYLGVVTPGAPITLQIESPNGQKQELTLQAMNEQEIMSAEIIQLETKAVPSTAPVQGSIYRALPLDEQNFFIQYNQCSEAEDLPMKEFTAQVKEALSAGSYSRVIVDLRYNSGGNSAILEPFVAMLKELKKQQDFTVYTLIGGSTFSSAIINAVQLKDRAGGILVGSPTGGTVNHYGEVKRFDLQHHPIVATYSAKYFELIKGYDKDSLYPDIEVTQTLDNYVNGIDAEVESVKQITA